MTNDNVNKQDTRVHYLYRIVNKINGKIYIGQSVNTIRRWYEHKREASRDKPNMLISRAIKKHGNDAFEFEVIAGCKSWDDANEIETLLVMQYNSLAPNGYNVSLGGTNAPKSEKFKQMLRDRWKDSSNKAKMVEMLKNMWANNREAITKSIQDHWDNNPDKKLRYREMQKGKVISEEQKQAISNTLMGHSVSNDTRKKQSIAKIGIKKGPPSQKTKDKIANAQKGELSHRAKLTWELVRKIRQERETLGYRYIDLSEKYGVGISCIQDIIQKKSWKE